MSVISSTPAPAAGAEDGFTLVEVLTAIICGVLIIGSLFTVLEISLHQTSRITDSVQATQVGRGAMTHVIDELHSACLAREVAPVQEKSTKTSLTFVAAYGSEPVISYKEVARHTLKWTGTAKEGGTLVDETAPATSVNTWPKFETFEAAKATYTVEHVYPAAREEEKELIPIFRYYKYSSKPVSGGAESATSTLERVKPPEAGFSAVEAKSIAAVQVTFLTAPSDNWTAVNRAAEFSSLVTFAFTSPASEATIVDGPCQ